MSASVEFSAQTQEQNDDDIFDVLEDPGTDEDEVDDVANSNSTGGGGSGATAVSENGWTTVRSKKQKPKQFWHPVFNRPTSVRYDGKGAYPPLMCPNRNKYGGCKTLLPCACGRVGHTTRHTDFPTLSQGLFMVSAKSFYGRSDLRVYSSGHDFDAHKMRKSYTPNS